MSRSHSIDARGAGPPVFQVPKPPRQPRSLYVLCITVALERFGFFLFSALFVLYLNERRGVTSARAVEIYGYFLSASYLAPLLGGRLCDGRLGCRRTALLGMSLQVIGYLMLSVEHSMVIAPALGFMSLGSGLFKAGLQALLSNLYADADSRREKGFSWLYVAINVGGFVAPLLGEYVQSHVGWSWAFGVAGIVNLLGLVVLALGDTPPAGLGLRIGDRVVLLPGLSPESAHRRLMLLLAAGFAFGAGLVQCHSTLLLWARDNTERHVGSFQIPASWFAAAPSGLVLVSAPLLGVVLSALRRRGCEPPTLGKIALGILLSCVAFVPLGIASIRSHNGLLVSPFWTLACMAMLAIAELLAPALAPAEITRIAPLDRRGRWLSYWFLALAAGHAAGGLVSFYR